jgi:predicted Zn finger-like uncharacterized protein
MTRTSQCPHCHNPLRIPDDVLGRRVRCPTCQETFLAALEEKPNPPG